MSRSNSTLALWQRLAGLPGGKWLFAQIVCRKAPYFGSIRPRFATLRPGCCEIRLKKRRSVLNHIGGVHAIAMCNMAELAAGLMTEVSIPASHRWIPKGMQVEYLGKARTDLSARADLDPVPEFGAAAELPVTVPIIDAQGEMVCRAVITMWVSPRPA